jgi:hypothetical protein
VSRSRRTRKKFASRRARTCGGGFADVGPGDRTRRGGVPDFVAPFLEEVGIAVGLSDEGCERFVGEFDAAISSGDPEYIGGVVAGER